MMIELIWELNQGFDEFMNVVLDDAEEVYDCGAKPGKEVPHGENSVCLISAQPHIPYFRYNRQCWLLILGRILLKGDNITLIQPVAA